MKGAFVHCLLVALLLLVATTFQLVASQEQQNPLTINGGSVLAMAGKDCVVLAVDKRFASGNQMVNIAPRQVFVPSPHLMVAFTGLEGDVQSLSEELSKQVASKLGRGLGFRLHNHHNNPDPVSPRAMASLTSHVLYNRKQAPYYVEPLVVGIQQDNKPYLCCMDMIGAKSTSRAFVCAGAAAPSLLGTAEELWRPDLGRDELVRVCAGAFSSALERDCLSGYGTLLYLISKEGITEYDLDSRKD